MGEDMGNFGASLIQEGDQILTHCNAGALATAGIGCALGVIKKAHQLKKKIHVYVDEDYWNKMNETKTEGNVRVNLYVFKPYREDNVTEIDGMKLTTRLRTLIDLYCDDKAYAAEPLIPQLWT